MTEVTHGAHGEVVIHLDGNLDAGAAGRLAGWLVEVPTHQPLVLDFARVRICEESGLATVARHLAARERVAVRGLTRHQERVLRYLGMTLPEEHAAADGDRDAPGDP